MLSLGCQTSRFCHGISRRAMLRLGALSAIGLTLPDLLRAREAAASAPKAKRCILFFLEGGLAHQDTFDPKPDAPDGLGGEFKPIPTRLAGIRFTEHVPRLAKVNDRFALLRAVSHDVYDHNAGAYYCLSGHSPKTPSGLIVGDRRTNFPGIGAIAASLLPKHPSVPDFVHCPNILTNNNEDLPGQKAGWLGGACDPLVLADPTSAAYKSSPFGGGGLTRERSERRRNLLSEAREQLAYLADTGPGRSVDAYYERAFSLVTSGETREACDLSAEPEKVRERYGKHPMGQKLLLARRLSEAGVPLVQVCWGAKSGSDSNQNWDTHRRNFHFLKNSLLPPTDQGLSALIEDLDDRGLLSETLLVVMGEFGRTPQINRDGGRDHWPHAYSMLLAGAGIQRGVVHGESDEKAAYPVSGAVGPEDVAATIFAALGIPPQSEIRDPQDRPWSISTGEPIRAVLA